MPANVMYSQPIRFANNMLHAAPRAFFSSAGAIKPPYAVSSHCEGCQLLGAFAELVSDPIPSRNAPVQSLQPFWSCQACHHLLSVGLHAGMTDVFLRLPSMTCAFDCRERTVSESGDVVLDMNVATRNRANAFLAICLAIFLIAELSVFIAIVNRTAVRLLLGPVNRILALLRTNAAKILQALDKDQVSRIVMLTARHTLMSCMQGF